MVRATVSLGRIQPTSRTWSPLGYRWKVIHAIKAEVIDRMISYGAPIKTEERAAMINYPVQHFGDPAGR